MSTRRNNKMRLICIKITASGWRYVVWADLQLYGWLLFDCPEIWKEVDLQLEYLCFKVGCIAYPGT